MAFDNVRLPIDVERGATGGPGFKTSIISLASGHERRNQDWQRVRGNWDIGYGLRKRELVEEVYAFFHARRGRARGFRFRDWIDYKVALEPVAAVVGNPLQRQLVRTYPDEHNPYQRRITHPVAETLRVFVNTVLTNNYELGENGLLTFTADPGANVLATFEYDVPVRFDIDELNVSLLHLDAGSISGISIIELRQ